MEITHSIIFTNQILHKVYVLSNNYTKNNCHLTQSLYTEMKFSLWTNDLRHDERHLPLSNVLEARTCCVNERVLVVMPHDKIKYVLAKD
jgi:hypothetical protein